MARVEVTERVLYSAYEITRPVKARLTSNNDALPEVWDWRCPRCDTANGGELTYGSGRTCRSCRPNVYRDGNILQLNGYVSSSAHTKERAVLADIADRGCEEGDNS